MDLAVLDTAPEDTFDAIVRSVAAALNVPIALVSLVDEVRQWFKARVGLDASETPRGVAFCAHAILEPRPFVIPDSAADPRFADNPLVTGEPRVRSYLGAPLIDDAGHAYGTLCVIDHVPRSWTADEIQQVEILASLVTNLLVQRRTLLRAERRAAEVAALQFLNAELSVAHEKAVAADLAKSRFLATMSHELRTPLHAILGYAEIIVEESEPSNEQLRADAGRIMVAGKHLLGLIDEILDLTKLNSQQAPVHLEAMDLEQWARDVIDMARPLATKNNNTLTLQVEAGLEPAFTDASRLRQCLLNLVGNACKFTNDGLVSVSIFERDGMLHAKVSDTGIGMTEAQVAGLFQPFYQADASITRRFGGTGLGLSITQKVTALLGGRVTVISAPGAGSTFEIIVPMRLGSDLGPMIEEAQSTSPAA